MLTREGNWRSSEEGFRLEIPWSHGWVGWSVSPQGSPCFCSGLSPPRQPPGVNNPVELPQIRRVSDSAFMVPNGSNKMQEASCQMSLSSDITGESGKGICLHSRNSSAQGQGEAEMARGAESNLGLSNGRERLLSSNFISGSKHTVWHVITLLTGLDSLVPCRIPASITRQEEKHEASESLSYTGSNHTSAPKGESCKENVEKDVLDDVW